MTVTNAQLSADISALIASVEAWQTAYSEWLGGTATGGPNGDGRYPLTNANAVVSLVYCPAALASSIVGPSEAAASWATAAEAAKVAAEAAAQVAETHKTFSETARTAAQAARDLTKIYRDETEGYHSNVVYYAGLIGANATTTAADRLAVESMAANAAASEANAAISAANAVNSAVLAATFDPGLFDAKTDPIAAARLTGMIDPARIPVLVGQVPIVSSGGIADLTSGQQSSITAGTLVATTDGKRWVYRDETGSLSKTDPASYIEQGDVTPDYSVIANKPLNYQSNVAMVSGLQTALDGKSSTGHGHAIADVTGLQTALDGKSGTGHGHAIADVSGLQSALDAKSATGHGHAIADVSGLQSSLDAKLGSSSYTAADVLAKIVTVDGAGSGLDADLLDGVQGSSYAKVVSNDNLTVGSAGYGSVRLTPGTAGSSPGYTGYIEFYKADGTTRTGYIGFASTSNVHEINGLYTFNNTPTVSGYAIWHAGNDGAGSGLDADTVDGYQASAFGLLGSNNSWVGTQVSTATHALSVRADHGYIDWYDSAQTAQQGFIQHSGTAFSFSNLISGSHINLATTGAGYLYHNWNIIWHAGNDGVGSGLDADLLDGLNSAAPSAASTIVARNGSGHIDSHSLTVVSGAGNGLRLWDGSTNFSIYMSDVGHGTWGGRVTTETTSDYNMYFQMAGGTNRGWVFRNNGSVVGGLDGAGNFRNSGFTKSKNGLADYGGNLGSTLSCRYALPGGASYQTQASSVTGAIKIRLPRKGSSAMMKMRVEVFNYATGTSKSFTISAYPYDSGGGVTNWVNITAEQYGETSSALNVRFGHDGTYDCIWIGETSTVWQYPQVFVTDFMHGYSGHSDDWSSNWAVTMETAFDTVSAGPRSFAVFWNSVNDGAGSGLDADLLDGYNTDTSSNNANTIPVRDSNGYLNQRVISNLSGGVSDGMYIGVAAAGGTGSITRIYGGGSGSACLRVYSNYLAWFDGSTEARLWYDGNVPTNTWLRDQGGTNRFNFAAGSTTYFGSAGGYNFRNSSNADAAVLSNAGAFSCIGDITAYSSDARLKENARPIVDPLGKIDQINGYTFDWRRELVDELGFTPHQYEDEHGFLAQEIEKVVPDAVRPAPFNADYLTVKYERIVPLAIAGIKALKNEIAELKAILRAKGLIQ